jgi:hypothetical protein
MARQSGAVIGVAVLGAPPSEPRTRAGGKAVEDVAAGAFYLASALVRAAFGGFFATGKRVRNNSSYFLFTALLI